MHYVLEKDGEDARMTGLFYMNLIREGIAGCLNLCLVLLYLKILNKFCDAERNNTSHFLYCFIFHLKILNKFCNADKNNPSDFGLAAGW